MSAVKEVENILIEYYGDEIKKANALKARSLEHKLLIQLWELNNKLINENEELKNELSSFQLTIDEIVGGVY